MSATEEDINNVSAWAEVIGDMLWAVPRDLHEDVLNLALARQQEEKRRADENGGRLWWTPGDREDFMKSPGMQSYSAIKRLKALLIQVFAREIRNSRSPDDAAKLLFARQRRPPPLAQMPGRPPVASSLMRDTSVSSNSSRNTS